MKFVIDIDECNKSPVPLESTLFVLAMYFDKFVGKPAFEEAIRRDLVVFSGYDHLGNPRNPKISQKGVDYIESIVLNSEFPPAKIQDRFENLATQLRYLFPEGKKAGTAYMWRDSVPLITKRLKAFIKKYGDNYTDKEIIEATKKYVESFNGDYRYMQLLKYFILKRVNTQDGEIEDTSQLLSYLSNTGEDLTDDWNTSLK